MPSAATSSEWNWKGLCDLYYAVDEMFTCPSQGLPETTDEDPEQNADTILEWEKKYAPRAKCLNKSRCFQDVMMQKVLQASASGNGVFWRSLPRLHSNGQLTAEHKVRMQIVVRLPDDGKDNLQPAELAIIEMQGELESRLSNKAESLGGKYVGDLHFSMVDDSPIFIIGHHIIYGKITTVDNPIIMVKKLKDVSGCTRLEVGGIIRKKIVFKSRPKPIIVLKNA